jgi:hypothetical protein
LGDVGLGNCAHLDDDRRVLFGMDAFGHGCRAEQGGDGFVAFRFRFGGKSRVFGVGIRLTVESRLEVLQRCFAGGIAAFNRPAQMVAIVVSSEVCSCTISSV